MKFYRIIPLLAVLLLFSACGERDTAVDPADTVLREDTRSVYEMIGEGVTVDAVEEDKRGIAYLTVEGVRYELGMDFLSMAMVYNTEPRDGSRFSTREEVYNEWWRLYMQRWNYLVAEIPLYANEYYDIYHKKLIGFETTPYFTPADAIVSSRLASGYGNTVRMGSVTALTGAFRDAAFGKSAAAASDADIQRLTSGNRTVVTDRQGSYRWNLSALREEPTATVNGDGSITYTLRIKSGLRFSDGSPVTAKNYLAPLLAGSTPVISAAGGSGTAGLRLVGYDSFKVATEPTPFEGIRLLDDYTFSLTYEKKYADYYYTKVYADFVPVPLGVYLGEGELLADGEGRCYLSADFYRTEEKNGVRRYVTAEAIKENLSWDSPYPWSGPYRVVSYDPATLTAVLEKNPYYEGDDVRGKPSIDRVVYSLSVSETQNDMLLSGGLDILSGITGGAETEAALKLVRDHADRFSFVSYERAGYGKLGFRGDFGPTAFPEVRRAIMYTLDRSEFAQTFTGGFGGVVHGAYYGGFASYLAVKDRLKLNRYTYDLDRAAEELTAGGWIYNEKGQLFDPERDEIRYKKLSGYEKTADNLGYYSVSGKYRTLKLHGEYYMPLVINWYGTQPNAVTDLLITSWYRAVNSAKGLGMVIGYTSTDFTGGMGELLRDEGAGYNGVPKLSCLNFATSFSSAVYDFSYGWTLDGSLYESQSRYFIKDEADYYANYVREG